MNAMMVAGAGLVDQWVTERLWRELAAIAGSFAIVGLLHPGARRWTAVLVIPGALGLAILGLIAAGDTSLVAFAITMGVLATAVVVFLGVAGSLKPCGVARRWLLRIAPVVAFLAALYGTTFTRRALDRWIAADVDTMRAAYDLRFTQSLVEKENTFRSENGRFASLADLGESPAVVAEARAATTTSWGFVIAPEKCDTSCPSFAIDQTTRIRIARGRAARLEDPVATERELTMIERLRQQKPADL